MRNLMGVSILALSLALSTSAHAEEWFRLRMDAPVLYGEGTDGPPDMGGNNPIEIMVEAQSSARAYGAVSIAVMVTGIDGTYTIDVTDQPAGATWDGNAIQWATAVVGTYNPTIEVRDGNGILVASQDLELIVHGPLTVSTPQTSYQVEVGDTLTITPTVANAIGDLQWGSTPAELPEWLGFNATTGAIAVDTSNAKSLEDLVLTAVDQRDLASASTSPFSIAVYGSEWLSTLGGSGADYGYSAAIGSDGSAYVTGRTASDGAGSDDAFLFKYNASGALQWQRTLGGGSIEYGRSIGIGSDGAVYVVGHTISAGGGSYDFLLAKYSAEGTLHWQRTFGGTGPEYGYSVAIGSDGSVYAAGRSYNIGAGGTEAILAKYNSSGSLQWQRMLGGSGSEQATSVAVDSSGSVYVGGYTASAGAGGNDALIAKYNSSGSLQWQRTLGGSSAEQIESMVIGPDGSVYVSGSTGSAGAGGSDILLVKYSASGNVQWQRTLGGGSADMGASVAVDSSGSVYVSGSTQSAGAGGNDALIAQYNAYGTLQWQRTFGGSGIDYGYAIATGSDGSVYFGGATASAGAGSNDILLARLPADGGDDMISGPFIYQSSNLTSQASSLAGVVSNLSTGTPSLTSSSSTLAEGTPSLASTTTKFKVQ